MITDKLPSILDFFVRKRVIGVFVILIESLGNIEEDTGLDGYDKLLKEWRKAIEESFKKEADFVSNYYHYDDMKFLVAQLYPRTPRFVVFFPRFSNVRALSEYAQSLSNRLSDLINPIANKYGVREILRVYIGLSTASFRGNVHVERILFNAIDNAMVSAIKYKEDSIKYKRDELMDVILNRKVQPYYQPIVHLSDGIIYGYEALTRFKNTTLSELGVEWIFNLAMQLGLYSKLDIV